MKKIVFISQTESHPSPAEKTIEELSKQGCACTTKTVHQLKNADYDNYDLLIGVTQADLRDMYHICGGDFAGKMFLLTEGAGIYARCKSQDADNDKQIPHQEVKTNG